MKLGSYSKVLLSLKAGSSSPFRQLLERHPSFEAGQRCPDAEVVALAERHVLVELGPIGIERLGVRAKWRSSRLAAAKITQIRDLAGNGHPADLGVSGRGAEESLVR